MVANRPSSFVAIDGATTYNFPIAPTQNGQGQNIRWTTNPWQMGDVPAIALKDFGFRIALIPVTGGLGPNRIGQNNDNYSYASAETSYEGVITTAPFRVRWLSDNTDFVTKEIEFDNKLFLIGGQKTCYLSLVGDVAVATPVTDKDFGVSKAAKDAAVFQNELIVCMGDLENIWRRFKDADTLSGTANAAVTTTNTSLTDTRQTGLTSKYVGSTITCNGKTMTVTSVSGGNTFNGTGGWSGGGNPGNGFAWSMSSWAQYTDAVRGTACTVVDDTFWLGDATACTVKGALTMPQFLNSFAAAYNVGDTSYPIVPTGMTDYQGSLWVGKTNGMYTADPSGKFHNQTPQLVKAVHVDNCKGTFVAHGAMWIPSTIGLLKITFGSSIIAGPEIVNLPDYRYWVSGGVEWGGDIYLAVWDRNSVKTTSIIRMKRSKTDRNKYTFHQILSWGSSGSITYGVSVSSSPTVPYLFVGFNTIVTGQYSTYGVCLSRGGGRDIDDPLHKYDIEGDIIIGPIAPARNDMTLEAYVEGIEVVAKLQEFSTMQLSARANGIAPFTVFRTSQPGGLSSISGPLATSRVIMYAPTTMKCNFLEVELYISNGGTLVGTARDDIYDAYVFGYLRPRQTDRLIVSLIADGASMNGNGVSSGISLMDMHTQFSKWADQATLIEVQLQDYQENKTTRFLVTHVERTNVEIENRDHADILQVTLVRVPLAPDYGVV